MFVYVKKIFKSADTLLSHFKKILILVLALTILYQSGYNFDAHLQYDIFKSFCLRYTNLNSQNKSYHHQRHQQLGARKRACTSSWISLCHIFPTYPRHFLPHVTTFSPSRYRQLKQQEELKVEEEQILQAKLQQSSFHQQQEELERLRKAIGQTQFKIIELNKAVCAYCCYKISTYVQI